ncbi:MAG: hypothetical protein WC943_08940 [Elusimicrobiota bacterium]|jgi:hypothetical protein
MRAEIRALMESLPKELPVEAVHAVDDPAGLQDALDRLEVRKPAKIVLVPLTLSPVSPEVEAVKSLLGLKDAARHPCKAGRSAACPPPLRTSVPVTAVPALEDHPYLAAILAERLRELSNDSRRETVLLVAPDPGDSRGRKALERAMRSAASSLRRGAGWRAVRTALLRTDGTAMERARSVSGLRAAVGRAGSEGKALIVPFVLAWDEGPRLEADLKGLAFSLQAKTLMPHPLIADWVKEAASMGARLGDVRRFPGTDPARVDAIKALLRRGTAAPAAACPADPSAAAEEPCVFR